MFDNKGKSGDHRAESQTGERWSLYVTIEGVNGEKEEACERHVRRYDCAVCQQNRFECKENESEKRGLPTKHVPRSHEHRNGQTKAEEAYHDSATREERVAIRAVEE